MEMNLSRSKKIWIFMLAKKYNIRKASWDIYNKYTYNIYMT